MIPIDTIVSIKSGDEYGGKYTGKLGIIKKFTDDRVGVEFAGLKKPCKQIRPLLVQERECNTFTL